jgi:hypothetical protein
MTSSLPKENSRAADRSCEIELALSLVRKALENLKFGNVTIVVQDGRILQVDRHEKTRLTGV